VIQVLLGLFQILAVILFTVLACACTVFAIVRRRRIAQRIWFIGGACMAATLAISIRSFDIFTAESTDRVDGVEAFISNFGFVPPASVREIKVKNIAIHDAVGHYMCFTNEDWVFAKVLEHDEPLQLASAGTPEFKAIVSDYERDANRPRWAISPEGRTNVIRFKRDFMRHSYSAYYLWWIRPPSWYTFV
jgi:hypothetical protein